MERIIVVEDNLTFSGYVCRLLESKGFQTVSTSTCNGARKLFAKMREDDIVLADMRLPDGDGLLEMSLPPLLKNLRERMARHETPIYERQSVAFREIDHKIRLVAPTNMGVLVLGENGTGKEHIAEKIHTMSKRAGKPFVAVDCGLLSKELAASVLFGHEKGAFTGADTKRKGYWEEADGGTLFLDEIGNLPLEVQQMMLRALESKRYRPVGGSKEKTADVRIIAATNEDMQAAIAEKCFRQDLFHRIKEYTLNIPPLRECREDIMPLAEFFRELANKEFGKQVKGFDAEASKRMLAYPWGGNVRELKGTVRSAVLFTDGNWITADKMEFEETPLPGEASLSLKNEEMEKKHIIRALEQANGNRSLAAELLGIGHTTLYGKMKQYGIKYKE